MRILLLSAYDAQSHQYWRQGIVAALPQYDWTQLTLPGRYFSWRIRGNAMQWALGEREQLEQSYDLIVATSMVDLASLKGMVPKLAAIPTILYFHENQFVYPPNQSDNKHNLDPQMVSLYGALAADQLVFNSDYNRQTFLNGVADLLHKLPEKMPVDVAELLREKSQVLAVPLVRSTLNEHESDPWPVRTSKLTIRIVWAARWEYDKGPAQLLAILEELEHQNIDYQLCVLGQQFRNTPKEFEQIKKQFSRSIAHIGFVESRGAYTNWLSNGDQILSTALHEFQGLAVLEAVQLGCVPVLPDRLVYPELFGSEFLYSSNLKDIKAEAKSAVAVIIKQSKSNQEGALTSIDTKSLEWPVLAKQYQQILEKLSSS